MANEYDINSLSAEEGGKRKVDRVRVGVMLKSGLDISFQRVMIMVRVRVTVMVRVEIR